MKALIAKNENNIVRITGYTTEEVDGKNVHTESTEIIPNAMRVAQVEENEFAVHSDLFWVDCNSAVNANDYYYDSSDSTIKPINHAAFPTT